MVVIISKAGIRNSSSSGFTDKNSFFGVHQIHIPLACGLKLLIYIEYVYHIK